MDYINAATAYGLASYQAAVQATGAVWRAATSKTAQRTLVTTVLFGAVSALMFGVACLAYLTFYQRFMPSQVIKLPMHLQYGYAPNPYAIIDLPPRRSFRDYQNYDIAVTLHLPKSPANIARGNFMIALHLLDDDQVPTEPVPEPVKALMGTSILKTSARAAMIPYTDPLVSLASRLLFLAYHIFVPASETIILTVPLVERLEFRPGIMSPTRLVVDVQAGQELQVYSAGLTITAQLTGLRWFMYTWWVSAFLLFTAVFWFCEVFFLAASFLVIQVLLSLVNSSENPTIGGEFNDKLGPAPRRDEERIKKEEEDVPMTFPTTSGQLPLRYDPAPSHTTGIDLAPPAETRMDVRAGEADDEDEGEEERDYEEEERARDSGIGTSYSERDSAALRRRTSKGKMSD